MNLDAYHRAWLNGYSEKECVAIAEEQWLQDSYDKIAQQKLDEEYEAWYYAQQVEGGEE